MTETNQTIPSHTDDLDLVVSAWVEHLWHEGDGRSVATDTIAALGWKVPSYKGHLRGSSELCKAWGRTELPARAPPLPVVGIFGLAELGFQLKMRRTAVGILVGSFCLLRTGELFAIRRAHVTANEELTECIIDLGLTKSGQRSGARESVKLSCSWLVRLLVAALASIPPHESLVGPHWRFRKDFASLVQQAGLEQYCFKPYSLRRGGATELWRVTSNLGMVTLRGRWAHAKTARVYINDGLAVLAEIAFLRDHGSVCKLCRQLCSRFDAKPRLFGPDGQ